MAQPSTRSMQSSACMSDRTTAWRNRDLWRPLRRAASDIREVLSPANPAQMASKPHDPSMRSSIPCRGYRLTCRDPRQVQKNACMIPGYRAREASHNLGPYVGRDYENQRLSLPPSFSLGFSISSSMHGSSMSGSSWRLRGTRQRKMSVPGGAGD